MADDKAMSPLSLKHEKTPKQIEYGSILDTGKLALAKGCESTNKEKFNVSHNAYHYREYLLKI
jgi:hypothetical protein